MSDIEALARLIDPAAWEDHEPGDVFTARADQERYEAIYAKSVTERRAPSLATATRIIAAGWISQGVLPDDAVPGGAS